VFVKTNIRVGASLEVCAGSEATDSLHYVIPVEHHARPVVHCEQWRLPYVQTARTVILNNVVTPRRVAYAPNMKYNN